VCTSADQHTQAYIPTLTDHQMEFVLEVVKIKRDHIRLNFVVIIMKFGWLNVHDHFHGKH